LIVHRGAHPHQTCDVGTHGHGTGGPTFFLYSMVE
jgi:hypothetical protein